MIVYTVSLHNFANYKNHLQMSDVVAALKLTADPTAPNACQTSPLDADQSAVEVESGKGLSCPLNVNCSKWYP